MSTDLGAALADFFASTWPTDAPVEESGPLSGTAWKAFAELGLHLVGVPEDRGGVGGGLAELVDLSVLVGRHAADVPVAEATAGAWALALAGATLDPDASHSVPLGTSSLVVHPDGTVSGTLADVPWGATVDLVVAVAHDGRTVAVRPADAQVRPGVDLSGQPRDTLALSGVRPVAEGTGVSSEELRRRLAVMRVALLAGAMQAVSEMTRLYVSQRVQFGKPVGQFQAVQAHVVQIEQMAVMTTALAERLALRGEPGAVEVMAAQLVAAENALIVARAAHQAHGAIGMTREHRLQAFTRRLHTWSGDVDEPLDLALRLGALASQAPSFAQMILDDPRPEGTP